MKFAGYILAFYLVLLSVVPCCAFDDCPQDKAGMEQTAEHESGDDDCNSCSPFFNCEGCASVVVNFENTSSNSISIIAPKVYTGFLLSVIPLVHYDFWQPPKLSHAIV